MIPVGRGLPDAPLRFGRTTARVAPTKLRGHAGNLDHGRPSVPPLRAPKDSPGYTSPEPNLSPTSLKGALSIRRSTAKGYRTLSGSGDRPETNPMSARAFAMIAGLPHWRLP